MLTHRLYVCSVAALLMIVVGKTKDMLLCLLPVMVDHLISLTTD